jgi:hypothetical protein
VALTFSTALLTHGSAPLNRGFIQMFAVVIENAVIHKCLESEFELKQKLAIVLQIISHLLFH